MMADNPGSSDPSFPGLYRDQRGIFSSRGPKLPLLQNRDIYLHNFHNFLTIKECNSIIIFSMSAADRRKLLKGEQMKNILRITLLAIAIAGVSLATGPAKFRLSGCTNSGMVYTCCSQTVCCTLDYSQAGMNGGRPLQICN